MVEAVCVPWPPWSWTAALFEQSPLPFSIGSAAGSWSKMNEHEWARSRLGAMSGWVMSTPLSMSPMRTPLPVARAWLASSALIRAMSHWQAASGSELGTPYVAPNNAEQIATAVPVGVGPAWDVAWAGAARLIASTNADRSARDRRGTVVSSGQSLATGRAGPAPPP